MHPLKLFKAVRAGLGPDEIEEMLSAMGVDCSIVPVPDMERGRAFREHIEIASLPSSRMVKLTGAFKGGDRLTAIMIVTQSGQ